MPQNILLLQGPIGPFFKRFANDLEAAGKRVFKVNFNGGDQLFYTGPRTFSYRGTPAQWSAWLEERLPTLNIQAIYLFGDNRHYHQVARDVAKKRGIRVFVFEEGYIRPDFITLEEHGVNGHSPMSRNPDDYLNLKATAPRRPHSLPGVFKFAATYSVMYYLAATMMRRRFRHYQHHRPLNVLGEGKKWLVSLYRKTKYRWLERNILSSLANENTQPYFLVVLQVHSDMQISAHSPYKDVREFIEEVVSSFARHAPAYTRLVLKHHPYDRAYRDYTQLLKGLAQQWDLENRLIYVHDLHLPTLLKNALGSVTINSTVGLSSLHEKTPVKTMGDAVYHMAGLTHQGSLEDFWHSPDRVDEKLFIKFRAYLLRKNQINGNFFLRLKNADNAAGLHWPDALEHHTSPRTRDNHPTSSTLPLFPRTTHPGHRLTTVEGALPKTSNG